MIDDLAAKMREMAAQSRKLVRESMGVDPINPKLKAIAEEIKAILKREDIIGMVALCSGEQSEYVNWVAAPYGPSWSALKWEELGVRFKAKAGTGGHVERFRYVSTLKAINTLRDLCAIQFGFYDRLCKATADRVEPGSGYFTDPPWQEPK